LQDGKTVKQEYKHQPVLVKEVLSFLITDREGVYVDCTTGEGGHAQKILEALSGNARLIGIDLDAAALEIAERRLKTITPFRNFLLIKDNFINIRKILKKMNISEIDGVLFDLGVSSFQLDNPERGFSFRYNGPLDMRMDTDSRLNASYIVNNFSFEELVEIFYKFGEEPQAKRIARAIIQEREKRPVESTASLAGIIERAVRFRGRIHPATRVFQALRIAVNRELENLKEGIREAILSLKACGRICVLSFHSLEDRIVKNEFKSSPYLKIITRKPITPGKEEIKINPRARSAKLRVAEKTG